MIENETFKKVLLKHGLENIDFLAKNNIHVTATYINNKIQFRDNYELSLHQEIQIMEQLGLLKI